MVGNGLRPEIWSEFTTRFGISRVAEFYGASECNIAFVNALNVDRTAGICPLPHAVVEYDEDNGAPRRHSDGTLRKVATGEVGLLLSKVTDRAPFDGYTDEEATNKKLVRDAFDDGDCWFDTGDWCAVRAGRTSRSSTGSATRSAGRGRTSRPPRSRARFSRIPRSSMPSSTASRSPGPTVAPEWPR